MIAQGYTGCKHAQWYHPYDDIQYTPPQPPIINTSQEMDTDASQSYVYGPGHRYATLSTGSLALHTSAVASLT